jgi:2',3'-cyclic-nucleotide 2'-phosphodiesterase (5'-nucleotidase family)
VLILDAGSALMGQWVALNSEGRVMVEGMNAMRYDAMAIGQMDLIKGLDALKAREAEATFPFLSANLVGKQTGQAVFKPYTILERQGVRVGIIGLSDTKLLGFLGLEQQLAALDPTDTARRYVAELRDKVDLLIVLSQLGLEPDKLLARAVTGIDVIVGGNTRQLMDQAERVGNTLIVQQGYNGEWLGYLNATFDAKGAPSSYTARYIALDPSFSDDPELASLVARWNKLYPTPTPPPTASPASGKG